MKDVPQKQLLNRQVSVVAIGHDDHTGFPWDRRDDKGCKPRITSTVHLFEPISPLEARPVRQVSNFKFHCRH